MDKDYTKINIWWIRRDLRTADNQALAGAMEMGARVVPVFIVDPVFWLSDRLAEKRAAFLRDGLEKLDARLQTLGSRLVVRTGRPIETLTALFNEIGASAIFAEEDYTPYARRRDAAIARRLPLHLFPGLTHIHPKEILQKNGSPYRVYTPFSKNWRSRVLPEPNDLIPTPEALPLPFNIRSDPLPELPARSAPELFPAGEIEAARRLKSFTGEAIFRYAQTRDRPDLNATSGLSPYLKFGMLSARTAIVEAIESIRSAPGGDARKGAETWLNEWIWREFFMGILYHFPNVRTQSFQDKYRDLNWLDDRSDLEAWKQGQTGYPFVDAAMRQLIRTGWMHNRARMVTASFLVKDLLVNWQHGEKWFMKHLIDGDLAANNGGWQWSAGTGADAAPYFRIFNPTTQGKKFDPQGAYIRRWVNELADVPDSYIHTPWKMPLEAQITANCLVGRDYPEPVLDHSWARERVSHFYKRETA